MNKATTLLAASTITLTLSSAWAQTSPGVNVDAFEAYFSEREKCSAFIGDLVTPVAANMAALNSVHAMRFWLVSHLDNKLSNIVIDVQSDTVKYGVLNPERERDQIKVTKSLYKALQRLPGFSGSGCGPDVREYMMSALYTGLGGENSLIIKELKTNNIKDPWEQQWVILTAIMAGKLSPEWEKF